MYDFTGVFVSNKAKTIVADLFWSRMTEVAKNQYRLRSKLNRTNSSTSQNVRKISGFWLFAGEVLGKLRFYHDTYIDQLFASFNKISKVSFENMDKLTALERNARLRKLVTFK